MVHHNSVAPKLYEPQATYSWKQQFYSSFGAIWIEVYVSHYANGIVTINPRPLLKKINDSPERDSIVNNKIQSLLLNYAAAYSSQVISVGLSHLILMAKADSPFPWENKSP